MASAPSRKDIVDTAPIPWVALIRAIGPATHKKMSMQQLRDACVAAGLTDARTYIATGNVLFRSARTAAELKGLLTDVVARHDLDNAVFLRNAAELEAVLAANPFPRATAERPNHVLTLFLDTVPPEDGLAALRQHPGPERIESFGREVFIDYVEGVGRSKVTPALMERHLKQPGTARNMNTVRKLLDLSRGT